MQGPIPPALDLSSYPAVGEAIQAADELCEKYRALRIEVDILREENNRLRRMLENFLAKTQELGNKLIKDSPSSPKE
jgi:predicted  nucleic acid-binding Zn-ribbon protein